MPVGNVPNPAADAERRGIPLSRQGDTFESFDLKRNPTMRDAKKQTMAVVKGEAWCALLTGSYGTGKSHLAYAAANKCREKGWPYRCWKAPDFLDYLRGTFDDPTMPAVEELITNYARKFLLVIDDLGAEKNTEWASEQFYRLLDKRYEAKAPTIITTNVDASRIDGRIISRFREGLVWCEGTDQRG